MESIFKALLATGQMGLFTIFAIIIGYYQFIKPFLAEFKIMKDSMGDLVNDHNSHDKKLDKVISTQQLFQDNLVGANATNMNKIIDEENKARENIVNEFGKVKYLLEEVLKKEEKSSDTHKDSFKEILIELTKLQTRLEYMSPTSFGGIRK